MADLYDRKDGYGAVSRWLHWGMAILFVAQFVAAGSRVLLPKEDPIREAVWAYHFDLGITLFLLVLARGIWGLMNISRRPDHRGLAGRLAVTGHLAIYALMIIVPASRILSSWGSERGLRYFGMEIFAPQPADIAWTQGPAEYHGEMGWVLGVLILGHAGLALFWHNAVKRDGTLQRMTRGSTLGDREAVTLPEAGSARVDPDEQKSKE